MMDISLWTSFNGLYIFWWKTSGGAVNENMSNQELTEELHKLLQNLKIEKYTHLLYLGYWCCWYTIHKYIY